MEEIEESPDADAYPHKEIVSSFINVDLPQGPS